MEVLLDFQIYFSNRKFDVLFGRTDEHSLSFFPWDDAMLDMGKGCRRRLLISSEDAYGQRGRPPTIPPSADLVFDIELLNVNETLVEEGMRIRREEDARAEKFIRMQDAARAAEGLTSTFAGPAMPAAAASSSDKRRKRESSDGSSSDSDSSSESSAERRRRKRERKERKKKHRKKEKKRKHHKDKKHKKEKKAKRSESD